MRRFHDERTLLQERLRFTEERLAAALASSPGTAIPAPPVLPPGGPSIADLIAAYNRAATLLARPASPMWNPDVVDALDAFLDAAPIAVPVPAAAPAAPAAPAPPVSPSATGPPSPADHFGSGPAGL